MSSSYERGEDELLSENSIESLEKAARGFGIGLAMTELSSITAKKLFLQCTIALAGKVTRKSRKKARSTDGCKNPV